MAQTEDWSQFPEAPAEDWSQFPEADAAPAPKAAQPGLVDRGLAVMKNVGSAMLDPMGKTQPSQSDRIVAGANEISATQPGRARIEELGAPVRPEVARKVRETPQATEPWQQSVQAAGRADTKRRRENAPAVANLPADSLQQANAVPSLPSDEYQPSGTITGLQETLADGLARRAVESTGSDAMGSIVRDSVDLVGTLAKVAPTTGKMIFDTAQLAPVIGQIAEWGSDAMAEVISDISRGQSADIQAKASRLAQLARDGNGAQVAEYILAHPDLLADVAIPSAASMYVIGGVGRLTGNQVAASLPSTVSARARERIRQRAAEQGAMWANIAANAGSAFAETDGPVGAKYLAALIAGAGTRSVAKITGGGAEGAIARGPGAVAANPVAQVAGIAGREAGQEFVEGASESIGSQTGEYVAGTRDDVSLRQAINQGTIEALAAGPTGGAAGVTVVAEAMQNDPHRIGLRAADAIARSIENGQWDQASIDAQVRASMDPNPGGVDGAAGLDAGRDSGRGADGAGSGVVGAAGAGDAAQPGAGAPAVVATGSEAGAPVAATGGESVPALTTGDPLQDAVLALEAEAFQGQAPEVAAAAQAAMPKPAAPAEPSAEQKVVADSLNSVLPAEEKLDAGSVRIFTPAELPDNEAGATAGAVVSRGTAELLTGIGEALGRRVAFYDYPGADGHADGFWSSRAADTVFLRPAVGSASVDRVFGHELQHGLEEAEKQTLLDAFMAATADGQAAVDMSDEAMLGFLSDYSGGRMTSKIDQLRGQGMPAAEVLDTLLKERNTTREALRDEFVSDILGNRMAEPETWKKVFRNVAKQNTGVLRKIYRTLTDVINYLTNRGQSAQYREVEKHIRDLRAVRKAVAQVLASRMVKQQDAAPKAEGVVVLSAKRIGPFNSRVSAESSARYQPFDSNIVTGSDGKFYVEAINGTERAADRADDTGGASRVQPDAVADRRDPAGAVAQGERPSYGTPRENAVRVVGVHYSKGDRTTLNGAYFGTGMKGAEAERLRGADPELLSRGYFYVDTGNGITPESDVGPRAHDVELTNLYDAFADPLGLKTQDMNAFELAVIRAGFDGYLIRQFGNQDAAVLVGRRHKAVPVRRTGDGPQRAEPAPAPKLSPERELAQRLTSNRRFPAGQLPPARWADVIFGLDPEAHDTLAEAGMFEGDTPVYLSELAGRYVRQAAQPRLSAPRADRNNTVSAVVGARPGEYNWSPAAKVSAALADRDTKVANLQADVAPPPFAAPIQQSPNLERIGDAVRSILGSKGARTLIQDLTGVSGIKVSPIFGSWQGKGEPSFVLSGEDMTFEAAGEISRLLGFAFAQDAVVATQPWFEETDDQIPFLRISQARAMSEDQARRLFEAARAEGLDYSTTVDGRGATFLHFGDEADGAALKEKVGRIAQAAGLSKVEKGFARSTLHEAETYLTGRVGEGLRGDPVDPEGRPDLFRRTVDHLLVPYAKAAGAEGYRFSPDRFGERFGLTAGQVEYIRAALRPGTRLSAPRLSAEERAVEQRFQDLIDQNPDRMVAAYLEDNGRVLDTDKARPLSPDYLENPSRWSAAVQEPASDLVKRIYARLLAEAPQGSTVLFTGGGGGSGKGYVLEMLPDLMDDAEVVYDMTMASYGSTRSKIDQALTAGMRVRVAFVYRPPRLAMQGVLERGVATGRMVPIAPLTDAHANAPRTLQRLQEAFAGDDRVTIEVVRNVGKTPRRAPLSGIAMRESADLLEEFTNEVERYFAEGRIDAVARDAYLGRSETDSGSGAGLSDAASGDVGAGVRDDGRAGRAAPGGEAEPGVALSPRRADMRSVAAIAKMAPALLSSPQITTNDQRFADMASAAMAGVVRRDGAPSENVPAVNIPMAPMPAVLQLSGVPNQILTIHAQVLDKVMNWKHGDDVMGLSYQEIANLFRTPALVVRAPNGDIEMIFDRQGANGPLIGVVQPDVVTDGVRHAVVKSIYSRPLKDVDARLRAAFDPEKTTAKYVDLSRLRGVYEVRSFTAGGIGTGYPGALKIAREGSASRRVKEWADLVKFVGDKYQGPVADTPQFSTPRAPVQASFVAPDPTRWDSFIYKMQDRFIDLKRVQASISEAGRQIQDQFDAYLAEELYHGRAAHRVQAFMQTELEPLLKKLKSHQIEIEAFERYLHARHAAERNAAMKRANPTQPELDALILQAEAYLASLQQQRAGATGNTFVLDGLIRSAEAKLRALRMAKPWTGTASDREMLSGMSDADAAQILKSSPKVMATLAKYVDKITAGTRDELRHYGLETDEVLDDMEKAYQFYVPLRRDMEESDLLGDMSMGTGQGFSVRGSKIKRATGSLRAVENILANIAAAREQAIVRGEKNRVTLALYGMALQHPNLEFWVAIRPSAVSNKAMRAELQGLGLPASVLQVMEDAPTEPHINERTGLVEHRVNPLLAQQPTVIALRVKGQDRLLVLSRDDDRAVRLAMALKNQDTQVDPASPLGAALRGLGITTRYLSSINTQYNPIFGLKNFIRDVQGAALNLTTTPIAGKEAALLSHVPTAMRAIWQAERGGSPNATWGALYEDFLTEGAQTGYRDMYAGMDDRAQALQRVIEPAWWQKAKPLNAVLDALSDYNTAIENAVRLSAYKVALDAGLSKPRAASVAKNLTVNFNRKGQVGREASAMYAFFNASVQGTARIWETLKGPKGKAIIAGGIGLGVMQALLGYAIMGDDWDDIPEYIRSRNLIIPLGGDAGEDTGRAGSRYVMIPMPLGFNALPSIGRIFTEMAIFQDKLGERALTAVTSVLDATNPLGSENPVEMALPSVLDPVYQLGANKNSFGQPIAREDMNSLDPTPGEVRFTRNATTFGKLVATGINRATGGDEWTPGLASPTPDQIDFVFGQVTGGVGRESMKVYQSLESLVTGDPVPASRVPVVGMFYGKTNSDQGIRAKYYAAVQDINLAERKLKGLAGSGGDVSGHLAERPQAALYKTADKIGRKISELNRYRATLTAADRDKKKQIDQEVMALQSLLIDLHEQAKAEGQ